MRMIDILEKKKLGQSLSKEELSFFVDGYTQGRIPDYQAAAFCMAVRLMGMTSQETADLTLAMAASGEQSDLSAIPGIKVDKHSTGGVGDKTTLVVAPIVAACSVPVAKMSGRGLGHTGGTLDKLESIPGFRTTLPRSEFFSIVKHCGLSLIGQSGNLAPADKKLYALRDVTATVDSLPLIASSIMSKKLASGADAIVLDVKAGSGAFMKTVEDATALAEEMVTIGRHAGKRCIALITNMDHPLGQTIGNSLEVIEAIETLKGKNNGEFCSLCLELATNMLFLAEQGSLEQCRKLAEQALYQGDALQKFRELITAQGGDAAVIEQYERFPQASIRQPVYAEQSGYLASMDTQQCGISAMLLGAGRATQEDTIDHAAGILLSVQPGDYIKQGQLLATLYSNHPSAISEAERCFQQALHFTAEAPQVQPLIYRRIE